MARNERIYLALNWIACMSTVLFAIFFAALIATAQDGEASATFIRTENEDRMVLPNEKIDEVWEYIQAAYVNDTTSLDSIMPDLEATATEEEFTDIYYDTRDLKMLDSQTGLRHRRRINLTDKDDPKNERELIQIKISEGGRADIERSELKFNVSEESLGLVQGTTSLVKLVDSADHASLEAALKKLGTDLQSVNPMLKLTDYRRRLYITRDGEPFLSFSLDDVRAKYWWAEARFAEIEAELNEITYTEADETFRESMHEASGAIMSDLTTRFPYLTRDLRPKYNKAFENLSSEMPWLRLWLSWGRFIIVVTAGIAVLCFFVGLIVGYRIHKEKSVSS